MTEKVFSLPFLYKLISILIITARLPLFCTSQSKYISAYWDGVCFQKIHDYQIDTSSPCLEGPSIFFSPFLVVYGHALLDGLLPLYALLKENNLLENNCNLIIKSELIVKSNKTCINILQLMRNIFPKCRIVLLDSNPLQVKAILSNGTLPINQPIIGSFSFYTAFPDSFNYITSLRSLGFVDNVVYRDDNTGDNIVKDFVNFILSAYEITPEPKKNRILIVHRSIGRKIVNLREVIQALEQAGYEIAVVDFEKLNIRQQIVETSRSEFLLSTYGSNLTNAIFLHPKANVVVLWHKYAKYFWSRRYCIIHSAFLSAGVGLIEFDKSNYDDRDEYLDPIKVPDYFFKEGNKIYLRPEKTNMDAIINYPLPGMYEILNVNLYIDPLQLLECLRKGER